MAESLQVLEVAFNANAPPKVTVESSAAEQTG